MKIVYFTDSFLPAISGVVTSLTTVSREMGERGHEVLIFAPKPKSGTKVNWKVKNVKICYVPSLPLFFYPEYRSANIIDPVILQKLFEFKPDVIHFHTPLMVGVASIINAKLLNVPLVGTFHGYFMTKEYQKIIGMQFGINHGFDVFEKLGWMYAKLFFDQCDLITAPSRITIEDLRQNKFKKEAIYLPNPIDQDNRKSVSRETLFELKKKLKLKSKVILFVGRISVEKSLDVLIRSFSEIKKEIDDVSLLFVGYGPEAYEKQINQLAEKLGISKDLVMTGKIEHNKLLSEGYFQLADVFATPSTSETQGMSTVEAMMFGIPVVGVKKKASDEMVRGAGLLAEEGDEKAFTKNILKILKDDDYAKELSQKSLNQFNNRFNMTSIIDAYECLYQDLISSKKSKSLPKKLKEIKDKLKKVFK